MALSGNFRRRLADQDKAPRLKHNVRHGDVVVLKGSPVPEAFSRKKVNALQRAGYLQK